MKAYFATFDGKGGVGKSTLSLLLWQKLRDKYGAEAIAVIDTDSTNSVMASVVGPSVRRGDVGSVKSTAVFIRPIRENTHEAVVVDGGARDEAAIRAVMSDYILPELAKIKTPLVVLRPVTTSSFVQRNLISFVTAFQPLGVRILLCRIQAMGRTPESYARWEATQARAQLLALPGVAEMIVDDLGAEYADEAVAFNLSFGQIAEGDFSSLSDPQERQDAERIFDEDVQLHFSLWMAKHIQRLEAALETIGVKA
jgi:hypothetical protein